jgi:hypothetical protein
MDFKRKQRIKGRTAKTYKEWYSDCKQYRISWRSEIYGVAVTPGFFACVRAVRDPYGREEYWGFASRRGLYRTLKAAQRACALNLKLWNAFLAIEGRAKVTQVRNLVARSMIGKKESAYSGMSDLPLWVCEKATPRLLDIIQPRGKVIEEDDGCGSLSDPTRVWRNSDESNGTENTSMNPSPPDGPVSDAVDKESSSSPTTSRPGKASTKPKPAKLAKGRAGARRKKSSKRTKKSSKRGKKRRKTSKKRSKN